MLDNFARSLGKILKCNFLHVDILDITRSKYVMTSPVKENRIYIRGEFTRKKCKMPFCCTVSILQVYFTYLCYITFWALQYHFIENLKWMLKENQIMKYGWFHNWPMIISHRLYFFLFICIDARTLLLWLTTHKSFSVK